MADAVLIIMLFPVVFIMNIGAYFLFLPEKYRLNPPVLQKEKNAYYFTKDILPYIILVSSVYLLMKSQGLIASTFNISPHYALAGYILNTEGSKVSIFQSFTSPLLTYASSFIYLFGFSFLLVFTSVIFIATGQIRAFQEYAVAFTLVYYIAFPFYIFTPVKVTGYTLPDVMPLLYNLSPLIPDSLHTVDPCFDNCFPSLHAALSVLALLFILFRTDVKGFKIVAVFITLAIQFTIFYLGIHWITDFFGGIILAVVSFYIATRYHDFIADRFSALSYATGKY